jgi:hypothetical protein
MRCKTERFKVLVSKVTTDGGCPQYYSKFRHTRHVPASETDLKPDENTSLLI